MRSAIDVLDCVRRRLPA